MKPRVLITGHTGFVGKNLVAFLKGKAEVAGYSRSGGNDVLDREKLFPAVMKADLVYHLAAYANPGQSIMEPEKCIAENVNGTLNVLEACRVHEKPMVYASSCEVYGDSKRPILETDEMRPPNPYAASKAMCDRLCYAYHKAYDVDVKIVRLFNPYGHHQQMNKIIPVFWRQATAGEDITVFGDAYDFRDYTYIDDIVRGLWMARNLPPGEAVNLATSLKFTSLEVAALILNITGSKSLVKFVRYPENHGGIHHQVGSNAKAESVLKWRPTVMFQDGLRRTIEWLEK